MKIKTLFLLFTVLLLASFPEKAEANQKASGSSAVFVEAGKEVTRDYREKVLEKFLVSYDSPLAPYAMDFVNEADTYNIDWRLVASISGIESSFGKQLPYNSYNAWGWGIYGDNIYYFKSYNDAIYTISKALRENYMDKWEAQNVYQIGRIYAASPTWAQRVNYFMEKIDQFAFENSTDTLSLSL